jgi:diaminopimelate decarboxylase
MTRLVDLARRLPADAFAYRDGGLHAEGVALTRIAAEVGTPVYVYSANRLRQRYRALAAAMAPLGARIHYAMKANSNQAVLALFASEGAGVDTVSGGEIARALKAGFVAGDVVYSGVGKTVEELGAALDAGIHQFNVESVEELRLLSALAAARGVVAPVALRVNPDVDAKTHAKITTGKKDNKFGIDFERVPALENELKALPGIRLVGLACHIGSQIVSPGPFHAAYQRMAELTTLLRGRGHAIERLDLGGGFGIAYENELELTPAEVAATIKDTVGALGCRLSIEPGRSLVADAGVLMAKVIVVKDAGAMQFLIIDGAMNDLIRPAMYDSHHDIVPVRAPAAGDADVSYDVVGPICESSDTFAKRRLLPEQRMGDLIVFATAGAYGATMSSTYNARPLVAEVMVDGDRYAVVRRRFGIDEQIALETIPDFARAGASGVARAEAAE